MGLVHARIQLSNALRTDLAAVEVDALVAARNLASLPETAK